MLDADKIIQVDVLTITNLKLFSVTHGFSFPENFAVDNPIDNLLIIHGNNLPEIERGKTIFAVVYTKGGDRIQYMGKVNISTTDYFNAMLRIDKPHLMQERRRYFKIKANEDCIVNKVIRDDGTVPEEIKVPYNARIGDINLGGIFLIQRYAKLELNDRVSVVIDCGNNSLEIQAEIIRIQYNGDDIDGYGCRFIGVNSKQEDIISGYINRLQLKLRKQEREKNGDFF